MKIDTHPQYADVNVKCSCGNEFTTRSTRGGAISLELCNECHPFFTGKQKLQQALRRSYQRSSSPRVILRGASRHGFYFHFGISHGTSRH